MVEFVRSVELKGTNIQKKILDELITDLPSNYLKSVNEIYNREELSNVRKSVNKCTPYGSDKWVERMVEKYNLIGTTRNPGRPKKL